MDWADEFGVESFWVTTQDRYDQFLRLMIGYEWTKEDEIYFGTNEFVTFGSTDELLSSLKVTPITKEFYTQLLSHFGPEYGLVHITQFEDHVLYKIEEDEEEKLEKENEGKDYVGYGIQ